MPGLKTLLCCTMYACKYSMYMYDNLAMVIKISKAYVSMCYAFYYYHSKAFKTLSKAHVS